MYDVIVAGAGPAGSSCARACARYGLRTLLLDRVPFPRPKPCGGAVSARALSLLGFPLPGSLIESECCGAQVHYGKLWTEVRKDRRIAVLVDRARFDAHLAGEAVSAGASFLQGERVTDLSDAESRLIVSTCRNRYETRFLVGADGVHSTVSRFVRPPFRPDETVLASFSDVATGSARAGNDVRDMIAIHFGIARMGYGWLFPHDGYYSLGVGGLASERCRPREALASFGKRQHLEPAAVRGGFIPLGGISRPVAAGRVLLAGDAAGFADPIHGEGIFYAILSGKCAAAAIAEGIKKGRGPEAVSSAYSRDCESLITKQLRIALLLARLFDRVPAPFVRIFLDNKRAIERYLDIPAGTSDYRSFLAWLAPRAPLYLLSSLMRNGSRECVHGPESFRKSKTSES